MEQNLLNGAAKTSVKVHSVNIYNREKIDVVGAQEVLSSTEKEVVVRLKDNFMIISGTGMTILKLVPEDEELSVSGTILGLRYENKMTKKSFLGKVFK